MERIIAGKTKEKQIVIWKLNYVDLIILILSVGINAGLMFLFFKFNINRIVTFVVPLFLLLITSTSVIRIGEDRIYTFYIYLFNFIFRKKHFEKSSLKSMCGIEIKDDYVKSSELSRIIELQGINLSLMPDEELDRLIFNFGLAINELRTGKLVRMDKQVSFEKMLDITEERIDYYEEKLENEKNQEVRDQLEKKIVSLENDFDIYLNKQSEDPIFMDAYYFIVYGSNLNTLDINTETVVQTLNQIGMSPRILEKEDLAEFYTDFYLEIQDKDGNIPFPEINERKKTIKLNDLEYKICSIAQYPFSEPNAFFSPLFALKDTNVIIKFTKDNNIDKINKRLNRTVSLIGADLLNAKAESDKIKLQKKKESFMNMITELNDGSNTSNLFKVEVYIMYIDNKETTKRINNVVKRFMRCRLDYLNLRQYEAFQNLLPHYSQKQFASIQRDMQTSTLAGSFPFYSDKFFEKNGDIIGSTKSGTPVCFDMWYNLNNKRAETRTNANLTIMGASGKGKSYFMKLMLLNEIKKNTRIFILDPENEYEYIASVFNGQTIDVSGGDIKINPFEIFPDLEDSGTMAPRINQLGKHLPFLSDFFKITLPYLPAYAKTVLDKLVIETYKSKNIRSSTDISKLKPADFPTFDDLIKVTAKFKKKKGLQDIELDAAIEIYDNLNKFEKENMYGQLWNGHTTLSLKNEFTTFNFRSLDSSSSSEIRNAQMLLITKFLNREVIKNYELQFTNKEPIDKRILLIVDEAHVFIDPYFPVALDLMKNMTKRIRKYNGSFWVATQNIADFIGFDINTKTKATAVLNNCQYTALFGLKPNDMEQVREMYAKSEAGAFTEEEVAYLLNASQGDCLLLIDQAHRISFHTGLKDPEVETNFILKPKPKEESEEKSDEANIENNK